MKDFKVIKADHAAYVVSSLKEALTFWVDGMGATLEGRFKAGGPMLANVTGAVGADVSIALIEIAGQRLELLEYQGVTPNPGATLRPYDAGAMHLALNVDDVHAALRHVAQYGYRAQGVPQKAPTGSTAMYVVGPDGATIEFRQPEVA
ncbi:TPA: VOC family protein [Burkholderia cepacia]|uniref:VOC family protein n=1 Tax=Burkholderia cepacia TaxID=292 RepID=UPI001CF4DB8C|nr:VOC family protein [Burkholderia cepacia]MCA8357562.1 VOC family protein [Burkholderia cepacia]HDR9761122.1 VOC family protein [Burkholderia cepacia ATCC 25416]HDV6368327.1 VOC family protein [Burkholderia cepacia]